ncbi:hypothetical protein CspeluHIS016_0603050 [Cutaneotrichosporon spelunceum]|uniref:Asl1-like glycosyl hydrolase catalytic domain-containing protein n=1 Tax=Cutaneotrichosporon spelunceum TaxID=1672016 RepID=A0AAD3TY19_9TREE|nr:hypothetical protein CspeluHIS016_0603050 [Cutaneotrichosporon spelunceum]
MILNLAVVALLAGVAFDAQPVAAHGVAHHGRAAHQRLAERHVGSNAAGVKSKREYQVLTRRDGSKCRVRPKAVPQPSTGGDQPAQSDQPPKQDQINPPGENKEHFVQSSASASASTAAPSPSDSASAVASPAPSPSADVPKPDESQTSSPGGGQGGANGGTSNTGSKLGAAWPNGDWTGPDQPGWIGNYVGQRTSWYYTWSPRGCKQNDDLGLEFVPMLWGAKQVSDWHAAADSWPSSVKNALFFNEPNQHDQAGIDIYSALGYWINDFLPKTRERGIRAGGAAPTSAPDGVEWVVNFYNHCMEQNGNDNGKCRADFAAVHYYDVDVGHFQSYLQNFHEKTNLPLWVTEYACQNFNGGAQCNEGQTWDFHKQMAAWMDSQDWIERYAPFGMMRNMQGVEQYNALMGPSGEITGLGSWYISSA